MTDMVTTDHYATGRWIALATKRFATSPDADPVGATMTDMVTTDHNATGRWIALATTLLAATVDLIYFVLKK